MEGFRMSRKPKQFAKTRTSGVTGEQLWEIASEQNFICPLSGVKFKVNYETGEIYDPTNVDKRTGQPKRVSIDHDHKTKLVRGLLIQKVNWLIDQWEQESYGRLSMPEEIIIYKMNPPAKATCARMGWTPIVYKEQKRKTR
jgi:hypothetical protein